MLPPRMDTLPVEMPLDFARGEALVGEPGRLRRESLPAAYSEEALGGKRALGGGFGDGGGGGGGRVDGSDSRYLSRSEVHLAGSYSQRGILRNGILTGSKGISAKRGYVYDAPSLQVSGHLQRSSQDHADHSSLLAWMVSAQNESWQRWRPTCARPRWSSTPLGGPLGELGGHQRDPEELEKVEGQLRETKRSLDATKQEKGQMEAELQRAMSSTMGPEGTGGEWELTYENVKGPRPLEGEETPGPPKESKGSRPWVRGAALGLLATCLFFLATAVGFGIR
ncbi:hypothetical protein JD844_015313 [Phrynosoma platyrhinos]|uniref:Uncharacterized protein n=1 Tax=Phrynosoma platyrhinos TaxID=52577 RepID=A0ABQ7SIY2_PHRPL|nr:hypothetical protein JD844_015313 [Phrynosoma platyrhinos]